ncbi:MAG: hypothetical protein LBG29_06590, partial [Synergistaceae bacterium]|nr:hypothetical protein [Synergistaceae bacterium]
MRTKISLDEALDLMSDIFQETDTEIVDLADALNRVLARDIMAADAVPPFDRSPFDGYAMR